LTKKKSDAAKSINPKGIRRQVIGFLRNYQMDVLDVDFEENVQRFLSEMEKGLAGRKSTVEMIPTYLEADADVPVGQRVIAVDAGGTHFRAATVIFDEQKRPIIENLQKFSMPGIEKEVSAEEFFRIMAAYLGPIGDASDRLGFCFSYPVEMYPNKDGRLIRFSKEIKAPSVIGERIGERLNQALQEAGFERKHIVLLNDTVATLLAGRGYQNRIFGGMIGFILGTGTNCCYIEKNSKIVKKKDLDPTRSQIINTESGGFGRCHRGKLDIRFDKSTVNPGSQRFEKMISGAYLGPLLGEIVSQACLDGLFSQMAAEFLLKIDNLTTKEMNEFLEHPYGGGRLAEAVRHGGTNDVQILYGLSDRLTERAAKLAAINLSSAALQSGQGTDPTRPICIVAEGTTFYKMKSLKSRVEFYLKDYLENKKGVFTEIVSVENATLVGAAIAGLTN
jgi:hexokinase